MQTNLINQKSVRNAGIDLLRIVSMFMVVVLHVNGLGGIVENALGTNKIISLGAQHLSIVAVNLFALISGYVSVGRKFKIKNIMSLWLQVFFYSVGITLLFVAIKGAGVVPVRTIVSAVLPVITVKYWYFTSYFLLFFLTPALNFVVEKSTKKNAFLCILAVLILCCADGFLTDMFKLNGGYTPWWLAIVYTVGAFCKKWDVDKIFSKKYVYLVMYFAFCALGFAIDMFTPVNSLLYTFPTVLMASVSLLLFFSRLQIKQSKILTKISSASFAVYIIHMHPILCDQLLRGKLTTISAFNPLLLLCVLVFVPLGIYVACTLIEFCRQALFNLIGVGKLLDKIQSKADSLYSKLDI